MDKLILRRPSKLFEYDVMDYRQEHLDYGESSIFGCAGLIYYNSFDEWLRFTNSIVSEKLTREGVHASTFLTVREFDHKIVGSIQLRHSLTKELEQYGGQIGYGIRPSERRKGYATKQLTMLLEVARRMSLDKVLITCEKNNVGSAKTIINNGGCMERESFYPLTSQTIQKYWIML
ncbi:GNAT family N-acetyltransferase [Clostridium sp. Marseille-P299]|uniref:GNAT family N-acetyltransferase n=1 Tax=Clostridium sp. Marseille-P299 TaxID=1805477 RepID=UPI0008351C02|nr:GNAT family N-acetyltransferase [Clostridium sp. Marseille-P299]